MTYPMRRFSLIGSQDVVGMPSTHTSPSVGNSSPFTIFSAVVFPEPLRPSSTRVSPAASEKLRLRRIWCPLIRYETPRNSTIGVTSIRVGHRDQEILRERPVCVNPLPGACKPRARRHGGNLFKPEFVAGFCPDRFPFLQAAREVGVPHTNRLSRGRAQVHLDPPFTRAISRLMPKILQHKVGMQLAVDAGEHIEIERRGHACGVIVSRQDDRERFLKIGPQKQRITGQQASADVGEEAVCGVRIEIADRASQEQDEQRLAVAPPRHDVPEPVHVRMLEADDADSGELREFLAAFRQGGGSDINGEIRDRLPLRQRLQDPPRLPSGAASEFRNRNGGWKMVDDRPRMPPEKSLIRPGQAILRHIGDSFEECRADLIVKVLRGDFLLCLAEPLPDIESELGKFLCLPKLAKGASSRHSEIPRRHTEKQVETNSYRTAASVAPPCASKRPSTHSGRRQKRASSSRYRMGMVESPGRD